MIGEPNLQWRHIILAIAALAMLVTAPGLAQDKQGTKNHPVETAEPPSQVGPTVFEAVLAGKACKDDEASQSLTCEYKVGNGLHFLIRSIGQPDTGIIFLKSSADDDFFASFAILHGCVIVNRGDRGGVMADTPDIAFISPKNGKVYQSWEECKEGW